MKGLIKKMLLISEYVVLSDSCKPGELKLSNNTADRLKALYPDFDVSKLIGLYVMRYRSVYDVYERKPQPFIPKEVPFSDKSFGEISIHDGQSLGLDFDGDIVDIDMTIKSGGGMKSE